ncbi:MAG: hypothetical protein Q9160_002034 [Pyrenula sp. 1 TL-2023]
MSGSSTSRRKARRVARPDDEEDENEGGPVVRKPASVAPKQKSKLRMSFAPGPDEDNEEDRDPSIQTTQASRVAQSHLSRKTDLNTRSLEKLPLRATRDDERPIYSKDYLAELRTSTPLKADTSSNVVQLNGQDPQNALELTDPQALIQDEDATLIPSAAEIAEKKERRARLAKEQDYISLNDDENTDWRITLHKPEKDTRLVRDDEEFGEGFDNFVEDGTVALGRKAELEQQKRHRAEARELIDAAEDSSDGDDSDAERHFAYEEAQTRAGMDGLARRENKRSSMDRIPTVITPVPKLAAIIERFRERLLATEQKSAMLAKQKEALQQERLEIAKREQEIQALVTEAGVKYEEAREKAESEKMSHNADT